MAVSDSFSVLKWPEERLCDTYTHIFAELLLAQDVKSGLCVWLYSTIPVMYLAHMYIGPVLMFFTVKQQYFYVLQVKAARIILRDQLGMENISHGSLLCSAIAEESSLEGVFRYGSKLTDKREAVL